MIMGRRWRSLTDVSAMNRLRVSLAMHYQGHHNTTTTSEILRMLSSICSAVHSIRVRFVGELSQGFQWIDNKSVIHQVTQSRSRWEIGLPTTSAC